MSSPRTISLLIALAFLPLAGFASAQSPPTPVVAPECDGEPGIYVGAGASTIACVPASALPTGPEVAEGDCEGEPGTVIRVDGQLVFCTGELSRLTVSFHPAADGDATGPDETCGAPDFSHITATVPPSATPDVLLTPDIATTGCIQVASSEGFSGAVTVPSAAGTAVRLEFFDGAFVPLSEPSDSPVSNGQCAGNSVAFLQLDDSGPTSSGGAPAAPPTCVEASVSAGGDALLSVGVGIPAVPTDPCLIAPDLPICPAPTPEQLVAMLCEEGSPLLETIVCTGEEPGLPCDVEAGPETCIPEEDLAGIGTIGYHAEFDFSPTLDTAAPGSPFRFEGPGCGAATSSSNCFVTITTELFDAAGAPLAFADGDNLCRAQLVLNGFAPGAEVPYVQQVIPNCSVPSGSNLATFVVSRLQLVAASMAPGTVWTMHVEAPNQPLAAEAPETDGLLVNAFGYAYYNSASQEAFATGETELADLLDAIPTPVQALPKPAATIAATLASVREGAATFGEFKVTVSPSPKAGSSAVTFEVAGGSGHAVRGTDYDLVYAGGSPVVGNTFIVPGTAGVDDEVVIQVRTLGDTLLEYAETVEISLTSGGDAVPPTGPDAPVPATVTIVDDEKPTVFILGTDAGSDLAASEDGPDRATVRLFRSPAAAGAVVPDLPVQFTRTGSTATSADFGAMCMNPLQLSELPNPSLDVPGVGTVGLPPELDPNGVVALVPVPDISDCLRSVSSGCPARLMSTCQEVLATLTTGLAASDATCPEPIDGVCTLTISGDAAEFVLLPEDDLTLEGDEQLLVGLLANDDSPYVLSAISTRSINVKDNEFLPTVELKLNGQRTHEAGNPLQLTLTRTMPSADEFAALEELLGQDLPGPLAPLGAPAIRVPLLAAGPGNLDSDFRVRAMPGQHGTVDPIAGGVAIEIPAGEESATVLIEGLQDISPEGPETAALGFGPSTMFKPGATTFVRFLIVDDDPLPLVTIRATDAEAGEDGPDSASLLIERSGVLTQALTLELVAGGSARPGDDYSLSAATVTIPAGLSTTVVSLTPVDDELKEAPETARVFLVPATGFTLGTPSFADVRILDDDLPAVHLSVPDLEISEDGATSAVVRFHRSPVDVASPLTVSYVVLGAAKPGTDVETLPLSATIPAGATHVDVAIKAIDDAVADANEGLTLALATRGGYALSAPSSIGLTIVDNDLAPAGDQDGDGLFNSVDPCPLHADPEPADLDADGKGDACDDDQDGDGATDGDELLAGTDPRDADTDRDQIADGKEVADGTDPLDQFSPDYRPTDVEANLEDDGMHVSWTADDPRIERFLVWRLSDPVLVAEVNATGGEYDLVDPGFPGGRHTYQVQPVLEGEAVAGYAAEGSGASAPVFASICTAQPLDSDGDDLCDARELELGTDPDVPDSDGDGLGDGAETLGRYGDASDPLSVDSDGDGIEDGDETELESASVGGSRTDLDGAWIAVAAVLAAAVLVLTLVGVVRFMRRT